VNLLGGNRPVLAWCSYHRRGADGEVSKGLRGGSPLGPSVSFLGRTSARIFHPGS
jgi:hypothetical protein